MERQIFGLNAEPQYAERVASSGRRSDIQGLRAVAVLLVVAFHAGLPVPGGFVGVDVFFVISGYVITAMIHREHLATGDFKFGRFYLRRFKRLTPALAVMVAGTMVLAFCIQSPLGAQQLTRQTGVAAMLLVANFAIARNTGDYFAAPAEWNPLLHTWSLSVEEQFYLVFPAVLLLGWVLSQRGRRLPWATVFVGIAAALSFLLAMLGAAHPGRLAPGAFHDLLGRWWDLAVNPSLEFYGPFARWWEFAVGGLLALATRNRSVGSVRHARLLVWPGVALLIAAGWLINKTTPFPGPSTLLPVAGTLLLIAAGTSHVTWVKRFLELPAMVKIGDWSYSIYLWHWPLKVFATTLWPEAHYAGALAALMSILPAVASYRWVEQRFRRLPPLRLGRTFALVGAVVAPVILLAATLGSAANHYWIPRYKSGANMLHPGETGWDDFYTVVNSNYYPCSNQAIRDGSLPGSRWPRCSQSKPGSHVDVALVGDSHAEHLFVGLAHALRDKNIAYYIRGGELPVRSAAGMNTIIDHVATDPGIKTVIIAALWAKEGVAPHELVDTLQAFTSKGKAVFVTDGVPIFDFDATDCKYTIAPVLPYSRCSEDRKLFAAAHARYYPELEAVTHKVPGARLLNTARYFCDGNVCSMTMPETGALLYCDHAHLNNAGSKFLADRMLTDFPKFKAALTRR